MIIAENAVEFQKELPLHMSSSPYYQGPGTIHQLPLTFLLNYHWRFHCGLKLVSLLVESGKFIHFIPIKVISEMSLQFPFISRLILLSIITSRSINFTLEGMKLFTF